MHFHTLKQQLRSVTTQYQKENENRVLYEAKSNATLKQVKKIQIELAQRELEIEHMTKYIKNMEDEHEYEKSLWNTDEVEETIQEEEAAEEAR